MSLEKEDQKISNRSLPPIDYSITEAAVDHMASDADKFSGKRSLNSLSEKVKFLCIYATCGCCCWLTSGMPGRAVWQIPSQLFFENGGIDSLFEIPSLQGSETSTECAYAIKVCPVTCSI
ncbi:Probable pectinesterase 53 [Olea europaea subsp. europaea]|uniref:Probable pectinesterase 53 n=1 Tax=Olea europaea subsp. europaea TaxID=158383 RepID=A0A8S0TKR9_OLEEU|nr:Probable pectinesterase 53 [Olea europaea subsp. europaea]